MVKNSGISWNSNIPSKKGVAGNHKCSNCGRAYKMDWARDNHQRLCVEFDKAYTEVKGGM